MVSTTAWTVLNKDLKGTEYEVVAEGDATAYVAADNIVLDPADFGLRRITHVAIHPQEDATKFGVWDGDLTVTLHTVVDGTELGDGDHGVFRFVVKGR